MNIYFDTEFTNLTQNAKLISIGLVDDISNFFYAEISDNYNVDDCSDFCKNEVLIHLNQSPKDIYTYNDFISHFTNWLKERPNSVLICDSHKDIIQIHKIFPLGLPFNLTIKKMTGFLSLKRKILNFNHRIHKKLLRKTHHALDDAIVNRLIVLCFFV